MFKSPIEYLRHIVDEITFIEREIVPIGKEHFMDDESRKRAAARSLEIIGEAVKQVPEEFRLLHSDIDWKAFSGLRDRLIHGYFAVDNQIVWDVMVNELPGLKQKVGKLIV